LVRGVSGTLFGSIDLKRGDSSYLHTQLYNSLRELILDGVLQSEQRLPSSRVLADELAISRTTVLTVYDRLNSEGLLYSKTGAGSFVSGIMKQRQLALDKVLTKDNAPSNVSPPLSRAFREMYKR
jgi:GntR family transcriptional regulator/MocR family aminotransferase